MVPNTKSGPFDVASAITSDTAWSEVVTYDAEHDTTWTDYVAYTVTPVAATTSIVERDFLPILPSGNVFPVSDLFTYMHATSAEAIVPIATAANTTSFMTSATPFLYFTAYEVEVKTNGTIVTETIDLAQATAIEYPIKGIESSESASVVDLLYVYLPHVNPFIIHIESTVLGWEDDPVVVAQDTSQGQPFVMTLDWGPETTQTGGHKASVPAKNHAPQSTALAPAPMSTPAAGGSTPPGKILPGGNQPGGSQNGGSSSREGQSSGNQPAQSPRETVGTIGTNPVIVGPSSLVIVGSQTLQPGAPAVTIGGSSISVAPSATAIIVNGQTSTLPIVANPASLSQTVGSLDGKPVVIGPSSVVVVGTQTLQPGGSPALVGANPVSLAKSGDAIIVGSKTTFLPHVIFPIGPAQAIAPPPILTIGSSVLTANAATQFFIAPGQTLTPGGTATIGGQLVSLGPSAAFIVVAGSTQILPTSPPSRAISLPEIVVGGSTIVALPGNNDMDQGGPANDDSGPTFVISGETLSPGHQITVDGTTISLSPSGSNIVINGVTSTIANAAAARVTPPPLTIGGAVFPPLSGSGISYSIDGQLLTAAGVITVDGTTISLAPGATALIVNGATTNLQPQTRSMVTNPPILTIGTHTYTAIPDGGTTFVIDGQTLTVGGTIVVNGTTVSLAPGATGLIYGSAGHSTTSALFPATTIGNPSLTGSTSPSASAGATGQNGDAAPTTSARGAAHSVRPPSLDRILFSLGFLGSLVIL
ncbi:hypothetical protein N0V90_004676 [Kalmusia sp. IMI 367209]|nr:hypothetical protein N0V90_004676 [Kalmusia sp. IMI 367209]